MPFGRFARRPSTGAREPRLHWPAMATSQVQTSRQERLIGAGRIVLAASSLLAVWLDPAEPVKDARIGYALLASYLAYAVVVALVVSRLEAVPAWGRLITHGVDLGFFSLFIYFTAGPASPFNAYFVFALVCATVRWQWRGTLWTAVVSLAAYLGAGLYFGEVLRDPAFELHQFIIRGVYLVVVAVLLGYLGVHQTRVREEMSALAVWPREPTSDPDAVLSRMLPYAGRLVGSPQVVVVWTEGDEPWLHLAHWSEGPPRADRKDGDGGGGLDRSREAPDAYEPVVPEALEDRAFLCSDLRRKPASVLVRVPERPSDGALGAATGTAARHERWRGEPLHPALARRFGTASLLTAPLRGEGVAGRVLFLGKRRLTSDDLLLADVVAALVCEQLEHVHLTTRLQEGAATEERIRLARDLHDGVLQSMTGFALRLEAVRRQLAEDPAQAREALEEVQRLMALEQRDLRFFIQDLRPAGRESGAAERGLTGRLAELAMRLEREWELAVEMVEPDLPGPVPDALAREIYHLVREALVNAARHGDASSASVLLRRGADGGVSVTIEDDGRGFPVHGRFSDGELAALGMGPKSLCERVASLRGSLVLDSSPAGSSVDMVLPALPT